MNTVYVVRAEGGLIGIFSDESRVSQFIRRQLEEYPWMSVFNFTVEPVVVDSLSVSEDESYAQSATSCSTQAFREYCATA